jgi:hypothetical protein
MPAGGEIRRSVRARRHGRAIAIAALLVGILAPLGCSAGPKVKTTFLSSVDLIDMTDRMAASFAADEVVGQRTSQSPPWVVSIHRAQNFTNQIIPDREKWLYLARLRAQLQQSDIVRERNIIWIIPPERWPMVQEELGDAPPELRMRATHELTAEFAALTSTSGRGRSDAYLCEYQLLELSTGRIVWSDHWEVKRATSGKTYD